MSSDINVCVIAGRLTQDPETRTTPLGTSITTFNLANNYEYFSNGKKEQTVAYISCIAWGKLGSEVIQKYAGKGKQVIVTGRLKQRKWQAPNGEHRSVLELHCDDVQLLATASASSSRINQEIQNGKLSFDNIPF